MTVQVVNKIGERAGLFLQDAFPGLHKDKKVAQRLGVSIGMAKLLRAGKSWTVERLDQLEALYGDKFLSFLTGHTPGPLSAPAVPADALFWASDDGCLHHAPYGHAVFARQALGDSGCDLSLFAMRMFGWVAISARPDLTATVRYTEGQADKRAAARACDWLRETAGLRAVRRVIDADGAWVEALPCGAEAAADALARSANIGASEWQVERLPLGMADEFPVFCEMLQARGAAGEIPGAMWAAALRTAPGSASFLSVDGDDVTALAIGDRLGLDLQRQRRNVLSWPDTRFAGLVHRRMREARDGATLYRLNVPLDGHQVDYVSLSTPDGPGGPSGGVISTTVVRDRRRLAA